MNSLLRLVGLRNVLSPSFLNSPPSLTEFVQVGPCELPAHCSSKSVTVAESDFVDMH